MFAFGLTRFVNKRACHRVVSTPTPGLSAPYLSTCDCKEKSGTMNRDAHLECSRPILDKCSPSPAQIGVAQFAIGDISTCVFLALFVISRLL